MITRRELTTMSLKAVAGLMATAPLLPGCAGRRVSVAPSPQAMDWSAFVHALSVLAEKQFSAEWNQAAYVEEVISLMRLVDLDDAKFDDVYDGYVRARGAFPEIQSVHDGGHFKVASLEFEPGDEIRLHNHPDMTGVILCLSGSLELEAFNLVDRPSASGKLLLEQVLQTRLTPGKFATLTATHGNIHGLVATEYTELLDVFTPPYDAERFKRYRWYRRSDEPVEGDTLFEAWET